MNWAYPDKVSGITFESFAGNLKNIPLLWGKRQKDICVTHHQKIRKKLNLYPIVSTSGQQLIKPKTEKAYESLSHIIVLNN